MKSENFYTMSMMLLMVLLIIPEIAAAYGPDDIIGIWIDDKQESKTEFVKNEDGIYVGKLVWVVKGKDGSEPKDKKNPDKSKRNNPLVGTVVMDGITYKAEDKTWDMPWAYDPSLGIVGSGRITMDEEGRLVVKGSKWGITVTRKLTRVDVKANKVAAKPQ